MNDWAKWLIGPICAFIAAEISSRIRAARRQGAKDQSLIQLTNSVNQLELTVKSFVGKDDFREFKEHVDKLIEKLFAKLDRIFTEEGAYPCRQVGTISSHDTQINANTARLDRVQQQIADMERAMLESSPKPTRTKKTG